MKNNKIKIDPIDEALKLVYLNTKPEENTINPILEFKRITETEYPYDISSEKGETMIKLLYEKLAVDSLGELISKAIEKENISISEISKDSSLPASTIEQLQTDSIFANSIPIILLKNLLKRLQISFNKAQESIIKSFHILKNEAAFSSSSINTVQLSYKKRNAEIVSSFANKTKKSENQNLFQNEEALNKYLNRLSELYKK